MESAVLLSSPGDLWPEVSWCCKTAPGSASGFKGVSQFGKKWRARGWVAGKGMRTVWVASTPEEAAWMLARWHHHPCELPRPQSKPFYGTNGLERKSDGEERAPLSPRRLNASAAHRDEQRPNEPAKRLKHTDSRSKARHSVPVDY